MVLQPGVRGGVVLVQFSVSNFLSFDAEVTLSMRASADGSHPEHLIGGESARAGPLLRAAAIYGANASGKSNLLRAVALAQRLVTEGTRPGRTIPVPPFRLRAANAGPVPSKFQFHFCLDGTIYDYGFTVDPDRVRSEWLFATAAGGRARERLYFQRETVGGSANVLFGAALSGRDQPRRRKRLEFVAEGTRPNQLFLTEAVDRNVFQLAPIRDWFAKGITVIPADSDYPPLTIRIHADRDFRKFLTQLVRRSGTGISAVQPVLQPLDLDRHFPHVDGEERADLQAAIESLEEDQLLLTWSPPEGYVAIERLAGGQPQVLCLRLAHQAADGRTVLFTLDEESDGTQRLVHLLPAVWAMRTEPQRVFLIDELDRRLHPHLLQMFLREVLRVPAPSQLLFTTHDTNLLNEQLLRRDEIWFVEKDERGASHLRSLAEFKVRPDLRLQSGYLNGRFGALPLIQEPGPEAALFEPA